MILEQAIRAKGKKTGRKGEGCATDNAVVLLRTWKGKDKITGVRCHENEGATRYEGYD